MTTQREALVVFTLAVKDYAAWRKVWEAGAPLRERHGNVGAEAFQDPKDPNKLIVVDRYRDLASFERFLADPELMAAQASAGVLAPPTVLVGLAT